MLDADGFVPLLAVHAYGPELPTTVKLAEPPLQMVVLDGVILIADVEDTDTVAIAVVVHVPVPDKTVYVVVVLGVTTIVPNAGGVVPLLAVQTKGPAPDAVNV